MSELPDIGYPQTGDLVEAGTYACMNCPHTDANDDSIIMLFESGKLPECPVCGVTYWMKI
ncbi:MAG: zinc ribbon-containing protein [Lachnospiraceae bacterium]|nr:zinc ribbon-containing protein [Lachnospiraceae bacterium]